MQVIFKCGRRMVILNFDEGLITYCKQNSDDIRSIVFDYANIVRQPKLNKQNLMLDEIMDFLLPETPTGYFEIRDSHIRARFRTVDDFAKSVELTIRNIRKNIRLVEFAYKKELCGGL